MTKLTLSTAKGATHPGTMQIDFPSKSEKNQHAYVTVTLGNSDAVQLVFTMEDLKILKKLV